jgi:hypothetical protein
VILCHLGRPAAYGALWWPGLRHVAALLSCSSSDLDRCIEVCQALGCHQYQKLLLAQYWDFAQTVQTFKVGSRIVNQLKQTNAEYVL